MSDIIRGNQQLATVSCRHCPHSLEGHSTSGAACITKVAPEHRRPWLSQEIQTWKGMPLCHISKFLTVNKSKDRSRSLLLWEVTKDIVLYIFQCLGCVVGLAENGKFSVFFSAPASDPVDGKSSHFSQQNRDRWLRACTCTHAHVHTHTHTPSSLNLTF